MPSATDEVLAEGALELLDPEAPLPAVAVPLEPELEPELVPALLVVSELPVTALVGSGLNSSTPAVPRTVAVRTMGARRTVTPEV